MIGPRENSGSRGLPMGVLTVDSALTVRTWDEWLTAATGIAAADAHGRPLAQVVPSIAERGILERFRAVLQSGEVQILAPAFHQYLVPCAPRTPSTHFREMQQRVTLGPLREGATIVGVMATIEDVTERLDVERSLAAALRSGNAAEREAATRRLAEAGRLESPDALAGALRDEHWRVRRAAVEGLARHADRDMLRALISSLRTEHRDFNVLSSALQLLFASQVDVTAPLIELLHDPDPDLRLQAALTLGEQQDSEAVAALITALDDENLNVRFHAIEALGRLRAADAVDRLADLATAGDFFLAFPALDALAAINDGRVAPRLVPLLASSELRDPVADALGELGDAHVVTPLVGALNEGPAAAPVVRALARLHGRFEQRYGGGAVIVDAFQHALRPAGAQRILDAVPEANTEDLRAFVLVLSWMRGAAIERALTHLLARPEIRPDVIEAVVRQGTAIVDRLIEQLDADEIDVRIAAVTAIARIGSRRAVPALIPLLQCDDRALLTVTAGALGALADLSAFEPLLRLVGDADPAVRQAAVGALNSLGHPEMSARISALLDDPDPVVRESASRIAGYFGYRECMDALLARCRDADERVRRAALEQLAFVDDPRALDVLARAIEDDGPRPRAAAVLALGGIDDNRATQLLLSASGDDDAWVRYFAARALGSRGPAAVPPLASMAASDPATHVRLAAIESLGLINVAASADALLPLAASSDDDVACAALRALGGLSDDRAVVALRDGVRAASAPRRRAAVEGLARHSGGDSVELLEWTTAADGAEEVAVAGVDALWRCARRDGPEARRAVAALAGLTADPRRRDAAVAALGRLPVERISLIADALDHEHPEVRRSVVDALSRLKHPDASAAIRQALEDGEATVREAAVTALDRLGARGVARTFAQMARQDPSTPVRRAAAAALNHQTDGA